jgi:hypothetical protein
MAGQEKQAQDKEAGTEHKKQGSGLRSMPQKYKNLEHCLKGDVPGRLLFLFSEFLVSHSHPYNDERK